MAIKNSKFNISEEDFFEEKKEEVKKVKYCAHCGAAIEIASKFCFECGKDEFYDTYEEYSDKINSKYCVCCKNKLNVKVKFCPQCGENKFVKTKEELDEIYLNNKIKDWEKKINKALKDLEDLENEKKLLLVKQKELESKLESNEKNNKKEYEVIKKRMTSSSIDFDSKKKKVLSQIKEQEELKEFAMMLFEETSENEKSLISKAKTEQEKLTKEINDLNLKLPILEKEIKEIKAKIK